MYSKAAYYIEYNASLLVHMTSSLIKFICYQFLVVELSLMDGYLVFAAHAANLRRCSSHSSHWRYVCLKLKQLYWLQFQSLVFSFILRSKQFFSLYKHVFMQQLSLPSTYWNIKYFILLDWRKNVVNTSWDRQARNLHPPVKAGTILRDHLQVITQIRIKKRTTQKKSRF